MALSGTRQPFRHGTAHPTAKTRLPVGLPKLASLNPTDHFSQIGIGGRERPAPPAVIVHKALKIF